ncbi:MAG: sulfatase-like hydrolase/transferase, partial [Desulfobulbaceae bacterium]|nr:sulfatase-like hydrolase/transferase [Desulfobulbaceae bacterium]
STSGNMFIVLHQMGSHGPAYYKRYPEEFAVFTPECTTGQLQQCSREELVNTYDNTILYTDYFLSEVVKFLKGNSDRYNTAMMYVSDHGESLGENNIYLHGMPYLIAPDEQKHVPFITWFSASFLEKSGLNAATLKKRENENLSQDIIFHTILGAMGVKTDLYEQTLDLLAKN